VPAVTVPGPGAAIHFQAVNSDTGSILVSCNV
jgi:hypothetical protein